MVIPWDTMHNLLKNTNEPHYGEPIEIFGFENPLRHFIKFIVFNPRFLILFEKIYFIPRHFMF